MACVAISDLYLFPGIVFFLNACFMFSKNLMLSFIGKVTTGTKSLALFISNIVLVVDISRRGAVGRYAAGLAGMPSLFNISDIA